MKALFVSFLLFQALLTFAQSSISVGPELGVPANFSKSTSVGFGGSLDLAYNIAPSFGPRISLGYNRFKGRYLEDDVISFVPIRVGIQGILADAIILYGEAGTAFYHANRNGTNEKNFSYALGAGYMIPLGHKEFLQVSGSYNFFRYNEYLTYTWFNFRVAYGLNFRKQSKEPTL